MMLDPQRYIIEGVGQCELYNLLEVILGGEAQKVHNAFLEGRILQTVSTETIGERVMPNATAPLGGLCRNRQPYRLSS